MCGRMEKREIGGSRNLVEKERQFPRSNVTTLSSARRVRKNVFFRLILTEKWFLFDLSQTRDERNN